MPSATLTITGRKLAFGDSAINSNPQNRYFDWAQNQVVQVDNPKMVPMDVAPGDTVTVFSGQRSTSIGSGTQFTMALSPISSITYRFTWTGTGTNPVFRVDRGLTLSTSSVVVTANSNQTVSFAGTTGAFSAVQVGDTLFIPGPMTGDSTSPFNASNQGLWTVISKDGTSTTLQLQRPAPAGFLAATETVPVTANGQVIAFSAAGVQVGDSVDISAGFSTSIQKTYTVTAITPTWFEVVDTTGLPVTETAVPGTTGIAFFSSPRTYIMVICSQEAVVRLNGDTGNTNRVSPIAAGDEGQTGWYEKWGPVWSLVVVNRSNTVMSLKVLAAE